MWLEEKLSTPPAYDNAVVTIGDRIYCFGSEDDCAFVHVFYLETTTLRITRLLHNNRANNRCIPLDRISFTVVAYSKKAYLWGGLLRTHDFVDDKLYCLDTETSLWSIAQTNGFGPLACTGHTACVIRNRMYTFGGVVNVTGRYTNTLHCLNLDTMEWSIVYARGAHVCPTAFHSMVTVADRMYVIGGIKNQARGALPVYCFDTVTSTWSQSLPEIVPAYRGLYCTWAYRDYIFMFGGSDGSSPYDGVVSTDLWRYSLSDNVWDRTEVYGKVPKLSGGQHCAVVDDKVYIFCCECSRPYHIAAHENDDDDDDSGTRGPRVQCRSSIYVLSNVHSLRTECIVQALKHGLDLTHIMSDDIQRLIQLLRK